MIDVYLDNRVRIARAQLAPLPDLARDLREAFEHKNPQFAKMRALGLPTWSEPAVIRTWSEGKDWLSFPGGGLQRVLDCVERHGAQWDVADNQSMGDLPAAPRKFPRALWKHQERLVQAALEHKRCILRSSTGSGKTTVGLALVARLGVRSLVIVANRALLDQWVERGVSELGLKKRDIGVVRAGGGIAGKVLTVGIQRTVQKLVNDREFAAQFGLVIGDEVQGFAAGSFIDATDPFPAKYRVGISASERRTDRKEFLLYDLFGPVAADITRAEVEDAGHTVPVEVRLVPTEFAFGDPEADDGPEGDDRKPVFDREENGEMLDAMGSNDERNQLAGWCARVEAKAGGQVLVMAHRREHCRAIERALMAKGAEGTGFLIGGDDYRAEFERTRAGLADGSIRIAIGTYQAVGTGIDLPRVAAVVCASPIAGNKHVFNQVRGRACRAAEGKTGARLYYLWDRAIFGLRHARNAARWGGGDALVLDGGDWHEAKAWFRKESAASRTAEAHRP